MINNIKNTLHTWYKNCKIIKDVYREHGTIDIEKLELGQAIKLITNKTLYVGDFSLLELKLLKVLATHGIDIKEYIEVIDLTK